MKTWIINHHMNHKADANQRQKNVLCVLQRNNPIPASAPNALRNHEKE